MVLMVWIKIMSLNSISEWWENCMKTHDSISPAIDTHTKVWTLALWWALWKCINDFIYRVKKIKPIDTINIAKNVYIDFNSMTSKRGNTKKRESISRFSF